MTPFAIAGVQMHIGALHENITAMGHQLDMLMARFPWVQMAMFSELAPFGPMTQHAQALPNAAEQSFQEMAARHGIWLLPGSMFEQVEDRIYNTASVIDPKGHVVGRYRKMFPFRPYEQGVEPGSEFLVFDVPEVGRFGVSICYDIWFPETTRTLSSLGVEVLLHPVLTGTTDRDVELSIARSTAAMFQCYVFDINGLGPGGNGRSCVIDPSGTVLHQAGELEAFIPMEIDLDQVRRQRDVGLRGLGQPLKSFRDRSVDFTVYDRSAFPQTFLESLGPLSMPNRGTAPVSPVTVLQPAAEPAPEAETSAAPTPRDQASSAWTFRRKQGRSKG